MQIGEGVGSVGRGGGAQAKRVSNAPVVEEEEEREEGAGCMHAWTARVGQSRRYLFSLPMGGRCRWFFPTKAGSRWYCVAFELVDIWSGTLGVLPPAAFYSKSL